ncbi:EAL domain-containing protein [Pelagerythrobacter marensis]|uniref:EAL domain-containing protein n=1 Tax=Pelagerythrobacter marensis TaxID=543877 RepID=A0ABZ2D4F7_9SPHN
MANCDPRGKVTRALSYFQKGDALSDRVRRMLVRTLYTQPSSLAAGAASGIVCALVVAYLSASLVMYGLTAALCVVAAIRIMLAFAISPDSDASTSTLEKIYEIGAFTYALLLGTATAATLVMKVDPAAEVMMAANAIGYGVAICARNAGRPVIAIGQLVLVCVPISLACIYLGSLPLAVFAVTILLMVPAMASITMNVFHLLRDNIAAAETSARLAAKMQQLARTDTVTGLANRAGLNHEIVEKLMEIEPDQMMGMIWIDLDRFKEVNDLLGHPVGDRVLQTVARRLQEITPPGTTVARFGGDEFIVFCEIDSRADCMRLASEVHAEIMRPVRVDGERLEIGASLGVAVLPEDGPDADSVMQAADLALYHAKVNGRRQTCFFDSSMSRDLARRREIEAELRHAIQKNELSIFFQPIVDLATGRIRTFEALVRWFHPQKGEMRPDEFIPVAEETGVIVTLGNWITAQAAKAAAQWPDDVTIAVNLSSLQIKAPGAALGIVNALREAKLDPTRLELEVTESLFLDDSEATDAFISELSSRGVRFALDDFGTGYSSLAYVNKYPFSKIKVDRSFVSGPDVSNRTEAIIRAVAEMGAQLDMEIVAEGLETIEQVTAVRDAGCTLGQGYYFSRAVPDYLAAMLLAQERDEEPPRRIAI